MNHVLQHDANSIKEILTKALDLAGSFLQTLPERPVGVAPSAYEPSALPGPGLGAEQALELFVRKYMAGLTGSPGPRYWGFVTGGSTPAAIVGDWLVSTFDQNAASAAEPTATNIERDTVGLLCQLFGLTETHAGSFVTGATMANFVGLALARQWIARQQGVNVAQDGLYELPPIKILSGAPHSSTYKALSMLGMGKRHLQTIATLPEREAVDIAELRRTLQSLSGQPCVVVGNAGTVNTVDFDDLAALAELKQEFDFWLHIDAAFGGFAACSPKYRHLLEGLEFADSITIDAHKWLNVPYDSAMQFTRHRDLQVEVFQNSAAYLGALSANPDFIHLTPENSRRMRALPAWFTLMAYGAEGYREIVERDCEMAQLLGEKIAESSEFKLLAPIRLNVVCFTLSPRPSAEEVKRYLDALRDTGKVFMTPTIYKGRPAIRAAFSNWRTEREDVEFAWQAMVETLRA